MDVRGTFYRLIKSRRHHQPAEMSGPVDRHWRRPGAQPGGGSNSERTAFGAKASLGGADREGPLLPLSGPTACATAAARHAPEGAPEGIYPLLNPKTVQGAGGLTSSA